MELPVFEGEDEYKKLNLRLHEIFNILKKDDINEYEKFAAPNSFFSQMINVQRVNQSASRGIISYLYDILSTMKIGDVAKRPSPINNVLEYRVTFIENPPSPIRRIFVVLTIPHNDNDISMVAGISNDLMTEMNMRYFNENGGK